MGELALKLQLDKLNGSLSWLHWWFDFWTVVVFIGVAFEIFVIVSAYREANHDFRRGTVMPPARPSFRRFVFELLGAGLVVAGIAGELRIGIRIGSVEADIRD